VATIQAEQAQAALDQAEQESKIEKTKARIREWVYFHGKDNVYVSFSGGKDSIVILDLVRQSGVKHDVYFNKTSIAIPYEFYIKHIGFVIKNQISGKCTITLYINNK
jgi:3'-phosphoadenosine 5'-phosphosulfate sulfotransferase (PAPS reductase)/FAD synthetase